MTSKVEIVGTSLKERILHATARSAFARSAYDIWRKIPVVGPLAHEAVDRYLPHGSRIWIRVPAGRGKGLWLYCDPRFEYGYYNGDHEPWVQDALGQHLSPGDCFYDVGAHTGFLSLIAARIVGEKGLVVALEADPENAQRLRDNVSRNAMPQIKVVEAAVWSSCGTLNFQRAAAASNRTEGRVTEAGTTTVSVSAVSLDHEFLKQGVRAPKLVKIDVEGGEWEVLQGAQEMLRETKPSVLCEVHEPSMIPKIQDFLAGLGYSTEHQQPVHPRYADYKQHYVWATAPSANRAEVRGSVKR